MLFGVPEVRDARGSGATDPDGILNVATRVAAEASAGRLVVQTDLCLDEFTDHGHCGVLDDRGRVDNDATLERYADDGARAGRGGRRLLGPLGHDGRPGRRRAGRPRRRRSRDDVAILAYAAKYASAFYGPFRDAVESSSRATAALPARSRQPARGASREVADRHRGGRRHRHGQAGAGATSTCSPTSPRHPTSRSGPTRCRGEYAMIEAAAAHGWIERKRAIIESVLEHPSRRRRRTCSRTGRRAGRLAGGGDRDERRRLERR